MREMKDSDVEWLGEVPAEWGFDRLGGFFSLRSEKVSDEDYTPLSVTKGGVVPQLSHVAKSDDHANRKLVCKGDFAINSRSDRRNSCGFASQDGSVSLINTICVPRGEIESRYFGYLFDSSQWSDEFYSWGHGIVADLWTTGWNDMKKILLPVPPLDEQRRIADFLDEKCAEIDRAVSAAEQSIEEYKTYKNSIVFQAATKGLDVDVPMKDSDVEWLGEVPAEWGFDRLGGFFSLRSEKVSDEDYTPLSVTKGGVVPQLSHVAKSDDHANRKLVCKGDFAINSRSDRRNSCGFASQDGSVSLINTICVPRGEIESRYFGYLFDSSQWSDEFYSWGHGIVADLWTTGWNDMKKILLPVPPLDEQRRIADFLDEKCAEIDRAVSAKQAIIADLKAYKQSLIYEAVTGKREV